MGAERGMTSGSARSGGGSGLPREAAEAMVAALKEAERAGGVPRHGGSGPERV